MVNLAHFLELQFLQSGWIFEIQFVPPLLIGTIWSIVNLITGSFLPHIAQV